MRRDLVVHHLVALDAQLRRLRALAGSIGSPSELQTRLPPLIEESCRTLDRVMTHIRRQEGLQPVDPNRVPSVLAPDGVGEAAAPRPATGL